MKKILFNTIGFSLQNSRFVFQTPESGKQAPAASPDKAKADEVQQELQKVVAQWQKENVPPDQIAQRLPAEAARIAREKGADANLSKAETDKLVGALVAKFKEKAVTYVTDLKDRAETRASEIASKVWDWAKDAGKVVGAVVAAPFVALPAVAYGSFRAGNAGVEAIKGQGADAAKAKEKEDLQRMAANPDKDIASKAKGALDLMEQSEAAAKKMTEANACAEKYSDASYFGKEKIGAYSGSDENGKAYDYNQVHDSVRGAMAAIFMLEGEEGVKKYRDTLHQKEPKSWTSLKMDGVTMGDSVSSVNDYQSAGVGGDAFNRFEKNYQNVDVASKTFAAIYLSKAKKTEGFTDEMYKKYEAYVEGELSKLNGAKGNPEEIAARFKAGLLTPDAMMKSQESGPSETADKAKELLAVVSRITAVEDAVAAKYITKDNLELVKQGANKAGVLIGMSQDIHDELAKEPTVQAFTKKYGMEFTWETEAAANRRIQSLQDELGKAAPATSPSEKADMEKELLAVESRITAIEDAVAAKYITKDNLESVLSGLFYEGLTAGGVPYTFYEGVVIKGMSKDIQDEVAKDPIVQAFTKKYGGKFFGGDARAAGDRRLASLQAERDKAAPATAPQANAPAKGPGKQAGGTTEGPIKTPMAEKPDDAALGTFLDKAEPARLPSARPSAAPKGKGKGGPSKLKDDGKAAEAPAAPVDRAPASVAVERPGETREYAGSKPPEGLQTSGDQAPVAPAASPQQPSEKEAPSKAAVQAEIGRAIADVTGSPNANPGNIAGMLAGRLGTLEKGFYAPAKGYRKDFAFQDSNYRVFVAPDGSAKVTKLA